MISIKASINTSDQTPKTTFGMRLFKSRNSIDRKGSVDSNVSPKSSIESVDSTQRRKSSVGRLLKKRSIKFNAPPEEVPPVPLPANNKTIRDLPLPRETRKLKKQQQDFPVIDVSQAYQRDKQTGEQVIDHTDLLHSLVHQESTDNLPRVVQFKNSEAQIVQDGEQLLSRLSMKLWQSVFDLLSVADRASLSLTCKAFRQQMIASEAELELPGNEARRTEFLRRLDPSLPNHLFCFACKTYHLRLSPGQESLKPINVANPVFTCPHAQNMDKRVSRVRLTSGRAVPFTFTQLALRAHHYTPAHGVTLDSLSRRWRDRDGEWSHQTRYAIVNDHLLVRVSSTCFAAPGLPPAGVRKMLYNPHEDFHPYFSTCPHWRDGELMPSVKCALSHISKPLEGSGVERLGREAQARLAGPQSPIVTLCPTCRPMRRCPECSTEYLIEIKMAEDRTETDPRKLFKQALVVTRWSDLGDGSDPETSREWAAVTGALDGFDSFAVLGKRALSGMFESQFNVDLIPGQRIVSMNPRKEKLGEAGHNWY